MAEQEHKQLRSPEKEKKKEYKVNSASRDNPDSKTSKFCILPHNPILTVINIDKLIACSVVVVIFTTI